MRSLKKFFVNDQGAVTVDWVVITAAVVGLTVMAAGIISDGTLGLTGSVTEYMSNWEHK